MRAARGALAGDAAVPGIAAFLASMVVGIAFNPVAAMLLLPVPLGMLLAGLQMPIPARWLESAHPLARAGAASRGAASLSGALARSAMSTVAYVLAVYASRQVYVDSPSERGLDDAGTLAVMSVALGAPAIFGLGLSGWVAARVRARMGRWALIAGAPVVAIAWVVGVFLATVAGC